MFSIDMEKILDNLILVDSKESEISSLAICELKSAIVSIEKALQNNGEIIGRFPSGDKILNKEDLSKYVKSLMENETEIATNVRRYLSCFVVKEDI